ncbi:MAG: hypothetical protein EON58_14710 [Alphaproteobacteria bacterium]|nr:MAG: hypothetical protein EON58_14710 [Alphaproteobacteria bacterium]
MLSRSHTAQSAGSASASAILSNPANKLGTNSSGQVQASSLSGYVVPPTVAAIIEAIRTMDIFQRMAAKLGLFGYSRSTNGTITSDTGRREDGGITVFAGNKSTKVTTITSNTPGNGTNGTFVQGTGGNPGA